MLRHLRITLSVITILYVMFWSPHLPVIALDPNLDLNVTPNYITINVTNPDPPPAYYQASTKPSVITSHTLAGRNRYYVGIRAASAYIVDVSNPANQIPISQMRWSRGSGTFYTLSQEWTLVNTYNDRSNRNRTNRITFRLFHDEMTTAGQYMVQIEFDARWTNFPWID